MTLLLRTIQVIAKNATAPRLSTLAEPFVQNFRVTPLDLDILRHMNNAKYLNYMEVARWGLQMRTGFLKLAFQQGWMAPIAHVEIKFMRPLKLFQKFSISAQLVQVDDRFAHIYQEFRSNNKRVAEALVTTAVRSRQGAVAPEAYLNPLGYDRSQVSAPDHVQKWLQGFLAALPLR